jgi:hypothetical protein
LLAYAAELGNTPETVSTTLSFYLSRPMGRRVGEEEEEEEEGGRDKDGKCK